MPDGSPRLRLSEIQRSVGGELIGDPDTVIAGVSNLELAEDGDLAFVSAERYLATAKASRASAFIVPRPLAELTRPQLAVPNPAYAFARIAQEHFLPPPRPRGIVEPVARGTDVRLGEQVAVGPFVTLGNRARIGAGATLYPGVYIGDDVEIGEGCTLYPNVCVLERCRLGRRVILHAGTVIGSDGFGYVPHEGRHQKIPQLGTVVIEDDVEIGANVTVDRATFGQTRIKAGTKVDNLVQIAHNVTVGEHCIIVAQVGIAGSTTLGHHVALGGQSGLSDHLTVGDGAMLAARSGALRDIPPGQIVSGNPAIPHEQSGRVHFLITKLPDMRQELKDLAKRVAELEGRQKGKGQRAKGNIQGKGQSAKGK